MPAKQAHSLHAMGYTLVYTTVKVVYFSRQFDSSIPDMGLGALAAVSV